MAIHASILAWRIPWTKEPGWLQFMGSQRVGHNRATNTLYLCVSNIPLFTFIRTQSLDGRASQDP